MRTPLGLLAAWRDYRGRCRRRDDPPPRQVPGWIKLRVLREAEQEIDEAASFYVREAPGVVGRFFAEVDGALQRLTERPLAYASVDRRFRGCLMNRFPYTVIYEVAEAEIVVHAFAHQSRRPGYWRDRKPEQ